jgi:hypothetical protein
VPGYRIVTEAQGRTRCLGILLCLSAFHSPRCQRDLLVPAQWPASSGGNVSGIGSPK